jgi:alpha-tubulin suppressor-like RCC1 family protein
MFTKKSLLILAIILSIFSGHGAAVTCGRLEKVSAGEFHSFALADDGTLWACGDNSDYQSGLGGSVDHTYSLMKVLGENGNGHLQNIVKFDVCVDYSKSFKNRVKAVLGFTPQAFDHAMNSVISTRLFAVSQL